MTVHRHPPDRWPRLASADDGNEAPTDDAANGSESFIMQIPLIRPNPPKLSMLREELEAIEHSGVYSNYGPVNKRLEEQLLTDLFGSSGACVTVANATLGLMLAVKQAVGWHPSGRYALMPSFTFAATGHAALWCGLTPLLCDIDRNTWLPDPEVEEAMLEHYGKDIAVMLPNATFGNCLDLRRYHQLSSRFGVPVVVDAAASIGSLDLAGKGFGTDSRHPLVFSMHATKAFATAEAGFVYCADQQRIAELRTMGNFGFGVARSATMPGLNSKLSEVGALLGLAKLCDIDGIAERRHQLSDLYRTLLPDFTFQHMASLRTAHPFVSVLVPEALAGQTQSVVDALSSHGIGSGRYFTPHLAEQSFFQRTCVAGDLSVTNEISSRIIALPMSDFLTSDDVVDVCRVFRDICRPGLFGMVGQRQDAIGGPVA